MNLIKFKSNTLLDLQNDLLNHWTYDFLSNVNVVLWVKRMYKEVPTYFDFKLIEIESYGIS